MTIVLTDEHCGLQVRVVEEPSDFGGVGYGGEYLLNDNWTNDGCLYSSLGDALFKIRADIERDLRCAEVEAQFTKLLESLRKKYPDRDIAQGLAEVFHKIHLHSDEMLVNKVVGALEDLDSD